MEYQELLVLVWLFSGSAVAAQFLGVDVPTPIFALSGLLFSIGTALAILHLCIGLRQNRMGSDANAASAPKSDGRDSFHHDQRALDRKAMETMLKDRL